MAKKFAPRVSKRERKVIDLSDRIDRDLIRLSDEKLLQGAKLAEIYLKEIQVKEQVRTKFNDESIKELAKNIEANGLIQPLVLHRKNGKLTLICGERRFRAMSSIKMEKAPCFILEGKSEEELMAIQFSENSSRENLHYIDKADGILNYQKTTGASERKICDALGISKSEVHRSLLISKMTKKLKEAAKSHNIEKYVLVEFDALPTGNFKKEVEKKILSGEIIKRAQLKRILSTGVITETKTARKTSTKKVAAPKKPAAGLTANAFVKAMKARSKDLDVDPQTKAALKKLLEETSSALS